MHHQVQKLSDVGFEWSAFYVLRVRWFVGGHGPFPRQICRFRDGVKASSIQGFRRLLG
jgi:hypothetical protein